MCEEYHCSHKLPQKLRCTPSRSAARERRKLFAKRFSKRRRTNLFKISAARHPGPPHGNGGRFLPSVSRKDGAQTYSKFSLHATPVRHTGTEDAFCQAFLEKTAHKPIQNFRCTPSRSATRERRTLFLPSVSRKDGAQTYSKFSLHAIPVRHTGTEEAFCQAFSRKSGKKGRLRGKSGSRPFTVVRRNTRPYREHIPHIHPLLRYCTILFAFCQ